MRRADVGERIRLSDRGVDVCLTRLRGVIVTIVMVVWGGSGERCTDCQLGDRPLGVGLAGDVDGNAMAGHPLDEPLPCPLGHQGRQPQFEERVILTLIRVDGQLLRQIESLQLDGRLGPLCFEDEKAT